MKTRDDFGFFVQDYFKTGYGAEIGVNHGIFSNQILKGWAGKLISVDKWDDENIYRSAKSLLSTPQSIIIRKDSINASKEIKDNSLDFVYIDACHSFDSCYSDILAWFPKVRHGGIIAGHDYMDWEKAPGNSFGVKSAVNKFCVENGYRLHTIGGCVYDGVDYKSWYFVKEIPRIIYHIWINDKPLAPVFMDYLNGWRAIMPDYEIRYINIDNCIKTEFVNESILKNKLSHTANYLRTYYLYQTGGIYFDIDIEVEKRFDNLLSNKLFIGVQQDHKNVTSDDPMYVNCAVIGSVKGHPYLKRCLNEMDNNHNLSDYPIATGPYLHTRICREFGWNGNGAENLNDITIYPREYFYPYYFKDKYTPACITKDTYCVHRWAKTW